MRMIAHLKGAPVSGNHNSDRRLLDDLHTFIISADEMIGVPGCANLVDEKIAALKLMDTVMGEPSGAYTANDVDQYVAEEGDE